MGKEYITSTVFISGHRDLTKEEFYLNYAIQLDWLITQEDIKFVIGDYEGCDTMAQEYLTEQGFDPSRVTIYHMGDKPMNLLAKLDTGNGAIASHMEVGSNCRAGRRSGSQGESRGKGCSEGTGDRNT